MYVLRNKLNQNYIGIDTASGGYPFETPSWDMAKLFTTTKAVMQYKVTSNNEDTWELFKLIVNLKPVKMPDEKEYKEYLKLKKKFE